MSVEDGWTGQGGISLPAVVPVGNIDDVDRGPVLVRDAQGRFLTGSAGPGRRKGSRNRLGESFLAKLADHFERHGMAAFDALVATAPEAYLRIVSSLLPREAEPRDLSDLTNDEVVELIERARRNRLLRQAIEFEESRL